MTEILNDKSFDNAKTVETRVAEMLKDGKLTREERTEIMWVWHMFRRSKDETIQKAREDLREFAIKNKYFWLAERFYTESWAGSSNESPKDEKKRLKKARNRRENAKSIVDLGDIEEQQNWNIRELKAALARSGKELRIANETLSNAETAKNSVNRQEIIDKKTALETAEAKLVTKNNELSTAKTTRDNLQSQYDKATEEEKKTLHDWLEKAKKDVTDKELEIKTAKSTIDTAKWEYDKVNNPANIIDEKYKVALQNRNLAQEGLNWIANLHSAKVNMLEQAKKWKAEAQAKEKKSQAAEVLDAERKKEGI